jgi:hypothetical protein
MSARSRDQARGRIEQLLRDQRMAVLDDERRLVDRGVAVLGATDRPRRPPILRWLRSGSSNICNYYYMIQNVHCRSST